MVTFDRRAVQVDPDAVGQRGDRRLGRRVGRQGSWQSAQRATSTRSTTRCPAFAARKMLQRRLALRERGDEVRHRRLAVGVEPAGADLRALAEPGVDDRRGRGRRVRRRARAKTLNTASLSFTSSARTATVAIGCAAADSARSVLEPVEAACAQREVAALRGELAGHLGAEAGARAGDQDALPRSGAHELRSKKSSDGRRRRCRGAGRALLLHPSRGGRARPGRRRRRSGRRAGTRRSASSPRRCAQSGPGRNGLRPALGLGRHRRRQRPEQRLQLEQQRRHRRVQLGGVGARRDDLAEVSTHGWSQATLSPCQPHVPPACGSGSSVPDGSAAPSARRLRRAGHEVVAASAVSSLVARRASSGCCRARRCSPPDEVDRRGGLRAAGRARRRAAPARRRAGRHRRVARRAARRAHLGRAGHRRARSGGGARRARARAASGHDLRRPSGGRRPAARARRFGVTAPDELRPVAEALVVEMGGEPVWVPESARPLYHAALSIGSNHLVTLVNDALSLLDGAGVDSGRAAARAAAVRVAGQRAAAARRGAHRPGRARRRGDAAPAPSRARRGRAGAAAVLPRDGAPHRRTRARLPASSTTPAAPRSTRRWQ